MKGLNESRFFITIIFAAFIIGGFYYVSTTYTCPYTCESPDITGHISETAGEIAGEYRTVTRVTVQDLSK